MIRLVGLLLVAVGITFAHNATTPAVSSARNVMRSFDSFLSKRVVVRVCVIDKKEGTFVPNLKAEDFVVSEDGTNQKATRFLIEGPPLSLLLLVDASGSMRPIIHEVIASLPRGLPLLKADDEVALMSFNQDYQLLQDFTRDKRLAADKANKIVAQRVTSTNKALYQAAVHVDKTAAAENRRVIILITDGMANGPEDVRSQKEVMQQLSGSDMVVGVIIVPNAETAPNRLSRNSRVPGYYMTPYIDETGGVTETAKKATAADISSALAKTVNTLRSYYRIEYISTNLRRDGSHRKVDVKLSLDTKKRGLTLLFRRGYYAPAG